MFNGRISNREKGTIFDRTSRCKRFIFNVRIYSHGWFKICLGNLASQQFPHTIIKLHGTLLERYLRWCVPLSNQTKLTCVWDSTVTHQSPEMDDCLLNPWSLLWAVTILRLWNRLLHQILGLPLALSPCQLDLLIFWGREHPHHINLRPLRSHAPCRLCSILVLS